MLVAASSTVVLGWVFIVVGFVFILLAIPAILKKAFASEARTMSWDEVIIEVIKVAGPAGVVLVVGVGLVIAGLALIGVKSSDLFG
jgi:hypothetical protein